MYQPNVSKFFRSVSKLSQTKVPTNMNEFYLSNKVIHKFILKYYF